MAIRPAWTLKDGRVIRRDFEFPWSGGFALSQKQKNVHALHGAIRNGTGETALEVSSKSTEELGRALSAFRLTLSGRPLENVFQSAKKYEGGGPYVDLLEVPPRDAKRDPRHASSGKLTAFVRLGEAWPTEPKTAFYDHIYVSAVLETFGELPDLSPFAWFTDIEFNPARSLNCQARAAAICRLLRETDGLAAMADMETWLRFHSERVIG